MNNPIYILGINGSSRSSAALLKNGQILSAALNERFTRIKNQPGLPKEAIAYCLNEADITVRDLAGVYLGFKNPTLFIDDQNYQESSFHHFLSKLKAFVRKPTNFLSAVHPLFYEIYELRKKTPMWSWLEKQQKQFLSEQLNINPPLIHFVDHHFSHGFAAYYTNPSLEMIRPKKTICLTLDGAGDEVCSRVFVVEKDKWRQIASTSNDYTIGWLYEYVTQFLGMKPNEDEYKVMGLAPYADPRKAQEVYSILSKMMRVKGLSVRSSIPRISYPAFLKKNLSRFRFDAIAGGIQKLTEELTTRLVQNAIKKTGINNVVLGGGVFMNVKANMKVAQIKSLKSLWVCPSSTDDSTAIGAAFYGYKEYCSTHKIPFSPEPFKNLYLGPSFKTKRLKYPAKEIAKSLASGHIVARLAGRMEFGARALGNRSILADPRNINIIKMINFMIKGRDFWMPFAPTILYEDRNKYLINPKDIDSPFMMLAFEATKQGQKDIPATLHPYDLTCRPQILKKEDNPEYYQIISEFKKLTGIGAILNTSFNLHGEPIVCNPKDARETFLKSGLEYLVIEDQLFSKKR